MSFQPNSSGANIDAQCFDGKTALHIAAAGPYTDLVIFLLRIGCSKLIKDGNGQTAGEYASSCGCRGTAQAILEYARLPRNPMFLLQHLNEQLVEEATERKKKKEIEALVHSAEETVLTFGSILQQALASLFPFYRDRLERKRQQAIAKKAARELLTVDSGDNASVDNNTND